MLTIRELVATTIVRRPNRLAVLVLAASDAQTHRRCVWLPDL